MQRPSQSSDNDGACQFFKDAAGKSASIVCLTDKDFDANGHLTNFKDTTGVIFFGASWCGHCVNFKPEFAKFSSMIRGTPYRAFFVDAVKYRSLLNRINPQTWGYEVTGFPTIVGYSHGKFYAEYGPDESNPQSFRTAEDVAEFCKGLGQASIKWKTK